MKVLLLVFAALSASSSQQLVEPLVGILAPAPSNLLTIRGPIYVEPSALQPYISPPVPLAVQPAIIPSTFDTYDEVITSELVLGPPVNVSPLGTPTMSPSPYSPYQNNFHYGLDEELQNDMQQMNNFQEDAFSNNNNNRLFDNYQQHANVRLFDNQFNQNHDLRFLDQNNANFRLNDNFNNNQRGLNSFDQNMNSRYFDQNNNNNLLNQRLTDLYNQNSNFNQRALENQRGNLNQRLLELNNARHLNNLQNNQRQLQNQRLFNENNNNQLDKRYWWYYNQNQNQNQRALLFDEPEELESESLSRSSSQNPYEVNDEEENQFEALHLQPKGYAADNRRTFDEAQLFNDQNNDESYQNDLLMQALNDEASDDSNLI